MEIHPNVWAVSLKDGDTPVEGFWKDGISLETQQAGGEYKVILWGSS